MERSCDATGNGQGMSDLDDLYQDAMDGSIYAAIAWMRHPQVCITLPKEIIGLIELEVNARNDAIEALKKELKIARNARPWIKCEDRLPKRNNAVIVCCLTTDDGDGPFVASGFLDRNSKQWCSQDSFDGSMPIAWPVTHWQALPEGPKS